MPRALSCSRVFIAIVAFLVLLVLPLANAQTTSDVFSVVLLPDTQYYSASRPSIFKSQTQWIVNHKASLNIQMVIGEGDIVDLPSSATQWSNADAAIKILDGKVPYTLAIGNHDYDGVLPQNRGATAYNQHFGPTRYGPYSWYGGNYGGSNENFYTFFTVNGQKYMVMALEYYPRNSVLTWASSVINSHPEARVMVTTHSFVYTDGTRGDACDTNDMSGSVKNGTANNAEGVWQKLLSQKANVMLVVSGHLIGPNSAHRSDLGVNGNVVNQIFTNYQNLTNGGNGYLRILTFHPSQNRIDVTTYSTTLNTYLTNATNQFSLRITNQGNTATTGGIAGKVRTPSCAPIAGAQVTTLAGETTTTDANGVYKFTGLPPSTLNGYSVDAAAAGYQDTTAKFASAYAGYSDQVDFYLIPNSTAASTTVTITAPTNGATVTSPVHVAATVTSTGTISYTQVYVDGVAKYTVNSKTVSTDLAMSAGSHRVTVQAKDSTGVFTKQTVTVTAK